MRLKTPNTRVLGCSFVIEITANDRSIINTLEKPIENFFLTNQYVEMIQKANEDNLEGTSLKIEEQIQRLDVIQQRLPEALKDQSEKSVLSDLGLGQVYTQMTGLYQLKYKTLMELELQSEVKLISGFLFSQKTSGITKNILIGITLGFVLTILAILWKGLKIIIAEK